jgi:hypothetical protein
MSNLGWEADWPLAHCPISQAGIYIPCSCIDDKAALIKVLSLTKTAPDSGAVSNQICCARLYIQNVKATITIAKAFKIAATSTAI